MDRRKKRGTSRGQKESSAGDPRADRAGSPASQTPLGHHPVPPHKPHHSPPFPGGVGGVACFQTNAPTDSLSTSDIIAWYRRKNRVEEVFHEIKSPLALRPLFVTRAQRIRAHVMACVLAYDLYNTMEVRLRQHDHPDALHGAESLGVQPDQSAACEIHGPNPPHDHRTHAPSTRLCVGAPV